MFRAGNNGARRFAIATGLALVPSHFALCDGTDDDTLGIAQRTFSQLRERFSSVPANVGAEISGGGVIGFATGFAAKRAGAVLLFCSGALFGTMQGLQHLGWVEMKYDVIEADVERYLDVDGDGQLTMSDLDVLQKRTLIWLQAGVPAGSGFGAGFLLGLRC